MLVRPIAIAYCLPLALYFFWSFWGRQRLQVAGVFLVLFAVLPAAWAARNAVRAGVFSVSTIGDYNLLMYRAAGALAFEDRGPFDANFEKWHAD